MGIADREYTRHDYQPASAGGAGGAVGAVYMWSVTTWLIVINVAVYVLNHVLFRPLGYIVDPQTQQILRVVYAFEWTFAFTVLDAINHLQIWRFVTFQFLHANLTHLLVNMFGLYVFGTLIEEYLGRRRYLGFYLLGGVGGGVMYVILWFLGFFGAGRSTAAAPLIGASAGVFGVLVAAARVAPNEPILIYGSIPARLKTLAWILIGVAVLTIFGGGYNRGGEAAHLGGAVVGYFLIKRPHLLNCFETGYVSPRQRRMGR